MTPTKSVSRLFSTMLLAVPMTLATNAIALADDLEFLLYNKTSANLVELYFSPTSEEDWEDNLMQSSASLAPQGSTTVTIADGRTTCMYDILGVFSDGDEVDEYDVDICELESYSFIEE